MKVQLTLHSREPVGKYFVEVCTTTPCQLGGCGSDIIVKTLEEELGVKMGHTTPDGKITVVEVECAGACVNAPVLAINNQYYVRINAYTMTQYEITVQNRKT
jgi:NADH dehydrogenase (ubiquinone) flavoprotein 2